MTYDTDRGSVLDELRARNEFSRLHRRALLHVVLDRLLGRRSGLPALDDAQQRSAGSLVSGARQLRDVPLERVRGSVGRARDYTAAFLPRVGRDEERWVRMRVAIEGDRGVPPLELVEVGGTYYVQDGHHRVSVLKRLGARYAEAYVTSLRSDHRPPRGGAPEDVRPEAGAGPRGIGAAPCPTPCA